MSKTTNRLRIALAGGTMAASAVAVLASPASATFSEFDDVLIDRVGVDVGGDGSTGGVPDEPATLEWVQAWYGTYPVFTGKIHFDDFVDKPARVQLVSYADDGTTIIGRDYSDPEEAPAGGHYERNVEEAGDELVGQIGAFEIKVILQTLNSDGVTWSNAGSQTVEYGRVLDTDDVEIRRAELDLGFGPFEDGAPTGTATLTWNATPQGINPILRGTLYAKNLDDVCVRTRAGYKDGDGVLLEEPRTGTEHCDIESDELHTFPVLMNAFFHNEVEMVTYSVQKKGGDGIWETVGQTTVELGENFILNDDIDIDLETGPLQP